FLPRSEKQGMQRRCGWKRHQAAILACGETGSSEPRGKRGVIGRIETEIDRALAAFESGAIFGRESIHSGWRGDQLDLGAVREFDMGVSDTIGMQAPRLDGKTQRLEI